MNRLKLILITFLIAGAVFADGTDNAAFELERAKEAIRRDDYPTALRCLARIQAFHYQDAERMPEALYYEAWIEEKLGGSRAGISALEEVIGLYPESPWCDKARAEFGSSDLGKGQ